MNLDTDGTRPENLIGLLLSGDEAETIETLLRLREDELGLTGRQAASVLGLSEGAYRAIKNGDTKSFTAAGLYRLAGFLERDVDVVVRALAFQHMTPEEGRDLDRARERRFIAQHFDLEGLYKLGFITTRSNFDTIRDRIVSFFRLESIFDYDRLHAPSMLSRFKRSPSEKMRDFYVRSALAQFAKLNNPFNFDPQRVFDLTPHIHRATRDVPTGLLRVSRALFQAGVTVIPQRSVPGLQARGATMLYNGKPCIVISDIRDDYSTMWFALMHELAHVIFHLEDLKTLKYHITGDSLSLFEDDADRFARMMLFSDDKLEYIEPFIDNPFLVNEYAKKQGVHPAIIYGFYAYKLYTERGDRSGFARFSQYVVKPAEALTALKSNPWGSPHYDDNAESLQRELAHANHG